MVQAEMVSTCADTYIYIYIKDAELYSPYVTVWAELSPYPTHALWCFGGPRVKNGRETCTGPTAGKSLIDL